MRGQVMSGHSYFARGQPWQDDYDDESLRGPENALEGRLGVVHFIAEVMPGIINHADNYGRR